MSTHSLVGAPLGHLDFRRRSWPFKEETWQGVDGFVRPAQRIKVSGVADKTKGGLRS